MLHNAASRDDDGYGNRGEERILQRWWRLTRLRRDAQRGRAAAAAARVAAWGRLAIAAALVGCGVSDAEKPEPAKPKLKAGALKITKIQRDFLTIETVGTASDSEVLSLPGRVSFRAQAHSAVGALTPGRVSALLVRNGEAVK